MNKVAETVAKGLFKAASKTATKLLTQEPEQYDQEPQEDQEQQPRYAPTTMKPQQRYTLVRVAPDCNRSYCEDSFSGYSGSV